MTTWHKASYSNQQGGNCVEVAAVASSIGVRDSKEPGRGSFVVPRAGWVAFAAVLGRRAAA